MKLELKHQKTKTLIIKPNGRSSDFVTPNFILGCNGGCSNTYCYTRRFGRKFIYVNQNTDEILKAIDVHRLALPVKIPNQVDELWTYDICCDTDLVYHFNDYAWYKVLDYFNNTPNIKATFATKYCSLNLSKYIVKDKKIRIRFSMMPQIMADILEPNTSSIDNKIVYIQKYLDSGWDVHINLSPIVITKTWEKDYDVLLSKISKIYPDIKFECIFLTHNENLHNINLNEGREEVEEYLWKPDLQETKVSEYGGTNLRYKWEYKNELIKKFKYIFLQYFKEEQLRYIF